MSFLCCWRKDTLSILLYVTFCLCAIEKVSTFAEDLIWPLSQECYFLGLMAFFRIFILIKGIRIWHFHYLIKYLWKIIFDKNNFKSVYIFYDVTYKIFSNTQLAADYKCTLYSHERNLINRRNVSLAQSKAYISCSICSQSERNPKWLDNWIVHDQTSLKYTKWSRGNRCAKFPPRLLILT